MKASESIQTRTTSLLPLALAAAVLVFSGTANGQTACPPGQLVINLVQAIGAPPTPTEIVVSGTASGCDAIDLTLYCQSAVNKVGVPVGAGWSWTARVYRH